jgi:ubiquinone/menaquinone biosynthesis C-methylase UbiE
MMRPLIVMLGMALAGATAAAQHGRPFRPEDLGLLEAPDRDVWQRPVEIMDALGIGDGSVVADLGAGGGWFTIRLSPRVGPNGIVYAEDVQPQMIKVIERRIALEGLKNIRPTRGTAEDPRLPAGRLDAALMVDAFYEVQKPSVFLRNLAVSLKPNGRLGIVEFTKEGGGPGPEMDVRVDPDDVIRDAEAAGFQLLERKTFLRYQYMLVFGKRQQ